jgi:hypothetical protein
MVDKYNHWLPKMIAKMNKSKKWAITLGQTAYYSVPKEEVMKDEEWIRHEEHHKKQFKKDGVPKFLWKYILWSIRYGYWNNPYEEEARAYARKLNDKK